MNTVEEAWRGIRTQVSSPVPIVIFTMIVFPVVYAGTAKRALESLNAAIVDGAGWWCILTATGFVLFALYCGISRVGNIGLGRTTSNLEFGVLSWLAMRLSTGRDIGLAFYAAAEPLSHYVTPSDRRPRRRIHRCRCQSGHGTVNRKQVTT